MSVDNQLCTRLCVLGGIGMYSLELTFNIFINSNQFSLWDLSFPVRKMWLDSSGTPKEQNIMCAIKITWQGGWKVAAASRNQVGSLKPLTFFPVVSLLFMQGRVEVGECGPLCPVLLGVWSEHRWRNLELKCLPRAKPLIFSLAQGPCYAGKAERAS